MINTNILDINQPPPSPPPTTLPPTVSPTDQPTVSDHIVYSLCIYIMSKILNFYSLLCSFFQ